MPFIDIGEHMLFALHYFRATSKDAFVIHLGLGSMGMGAALSDCWGRDARAGQLPGPSSAEMRPD